MALIADAHVHLYPCYDLKRAVSTLARNLHALCVDAIPVAFLAERRGQGSFRDLLANPDLLAPDFRVRPLPEPEALAVSTDSGDALHVFAGRQVVAAERIEVLSIACLTAFEDGLPAADVIERIVAAGGVPVLPWAPGKWMFGRGALVGALIDQFASAGLVLSDTSLRPWLLREPKLLQAGRKRGLKILAGSDPLPFAGEERVMGCYACRMPGVYDPKQPVTALRRLLRDPAHAAEPRGRRCGVVHVVCRLARNARARGMPLKSGA